jgi:hypothetical protein
LLLIAAISVPTPAAWARAPRANATCTWGGTPSKPTGTFSIHPGLATSPSTRPVDFVATGELGGGPGCQGTVRFVADIAAGSTCALATFDGRVEGLPGVARFFGQGSLMVPSRLFGASGRLVGFENANIMTPANAPHTCDCLSPDGFEGGWPAMFSSTIVRFRH